MNTLKALSLRQPWAYLVTNGPSPGIPWKPVENREWQNDKNHYGRTLIHASSGMTRTEYDDCWWMIKEMFDNQQTALDPHDLPAFQDLPRGGIVGEVEIIGYMRRLQNCRSNEDGDRIRWRPNCKNGTPSVNLLPFQISPWFFGTVGICLRNCKPLPFRQCKGMLGFFTPVL